jgi:hypothetical protein
MFESYHIKKIDRAQAHPMVAAHYLHKWPGVVRAIYGLFDNALPIGVIIFSEPPRETNKRYGAPTFELARLWITDEAPFNSETWFISRALKALASDFEHVQFVVSYADPSAGHIGTIYKASNWIPDGQTDEGRKTPRFDLQDPVSGKVYSRYSHIPEGAKQNLVRKPRISKYRYKFDLNKYRPKRRKS